MRLFSSIPPHFLTSTGRSRGFHNNRCPATGKTGRMDRQSHAQTERIFAGGEEETMQMD
jgi:hypothetical protein